MENIKIHLDRQRGPEVHSRRPVVDRELQERQEAQATERRSEMGAERSEILDGLRVESGPVAVSCGIGKVSYKDWKME